MAQVGSTISGRSTGSQFGYSVDMNFAGNRIVASGIEYDSYRGYIGIWNLVGSGAQRTWVQYGSYINGPHAAGKFGHSVSMNYAGTRILVGAPDVNRVYIYDDTGSGFSLTQTIYRSGSPSFGYAVSLAADRGLKFVASAPDYGAGVVYVYEKTANGANGFTLSHTDDGSNIYNHVPISTSSYVRLNSSFNRYGHSVHMAAFGRHYIAGMPGTRKESYPSSDHSGGGTYNNIAYSTNIDLQGYTGPQYSNHPFYGGIRPGFDYYVLRYPQYQVGYVRVKRCPENGNWTSGVTTVGGTTSTSSGNGGAGTIKGPNLNTTHMTNWNDYQDISFGGFGSAVQISPDGTRISASAPGYFDGSFTDAHTGRILYYEYDTGEANWVENLRPNLNTYLQSQHGYALAMGTDGSRLFASMYDRAYMFLAYDYSGSEWYRVSEIKYKESPSGELQGFSIATKSGDLVVTGAPGGPGPFNTRTGYVYVYEYPLTSVFRGNSLFEGYVKADEVVVGSTTNNTNTKRILFGGTKGDNLVDASTIQVVHLGTTDDRDSEILMSKWYGSDSDGGTGVPHGSSTTAWNDTMSNDRFLYGDRLRLKAPKIEFHLQPSNAQEVAQKYSEQPIITITSQDPGLIDDDRFPPRFLTNIRSGSMTSNIYAGLRLTSASSNTWVGSNHGMPSDGDYYTFSPANDGWLRLFGGASGQGNMVGSYASLALGNLYVAGSISGPGAPSGGGSNNIVADGQVASYTPLTPGNHTIINFNSRVNNGSDRAFILVQDESAYLGGSSNEDLRMTIGVYNDFRQSTSHSDELWLQGGGRLCYNVGSWDNELNTIIGTPGVGGAQGGVRHEWRINNSIRMALDSVSTLFVYGNVSANNVSPSDDRIKYNEEEITNCLGIVKQLRPLKYEKLNVPGEVTGTWIPTDDEWENVKNDYNWNDEYGFIAQDVRNIPGLDILVFGEETKKNEIIKTVPEYNELLEKDRANYTYRPDTNDYRHNDSGETQTPLNLSYIGIIPILTGAVQELSSDLEQEKQKTENLQTRLTASEQAYQSLLERVVALENA
jgi:hypothetical protein